MPEVHAVAAASAHITSLIAARTGFDFSDYQTSFLQRRFRRVAEGNSLTGPVELAAAIGSQPNLLAEVVRAMFLGVTELFRDPNFWLSIRHDVLPLIAHKPFLRVWVAGCATGEEAFTTSILLEDAGLRGRYRIYATDINEQAVQAARIQRLSDEELAEAQDRYQASGGHGSLAVKVHNAIHRPTSGPLGSPITFAQHNLAADPPFNSFDLVLCRNVLIYFNADLHRKVHDLLFTSLLPGGVLGLGRRESIRPSGRSYVYERIGSENLYRVPATATSCT
jgi:chemotaxis protein methyltransferase CheR